MSSKQKVIWYCHHYAGSPSLGMSFRPYYLTKEFSALGYKAYIIAASFHHLKKENVVQQGAVELKAIDDVNYVSLKTPPYIKNGISRIVNMLSYSAKFLFKSKDIIKHTGIPDIIIVSSAHPFHFVPLERVAKKYGSKLIFEVRDLWPLSLIHLLNMSQKNPLVLALGSIEKRAYKKADYVVSLLNNALPYMQSKGLSESKYRLITNGVSSQTIDTKEEHVTPELIQQQINQLKQEGVFLVAYTGALGKPNAMDYFIEALSLIESSSIHCFIVGKGALKNKLAQSAHHLSHVTFLPPIAKTEIPHFLKQMDLLYLGWNDSEIYQYGVSPNKIFDYMLSGRPILESCLKSVSFVERYQCGLCCEPADPKAIADALIELSNMSLAERLAMGKKGQEAVSKYFDYKILAEQYADIF